MATEQRQMHLPAAIASDPSTPSAQMPVFTKPTRNVGKRGKRPGRQQGHAGVRRGRPERIDRTVEHRADCCPDCGGALKRCSQTRDRYIEDVPAAVRVETVRHIIHRDWCPACRKAVEPVVTEALPNSSIGNGIRAAGELFFKLSRNFFQNLTEFFSKSHGIFFKISRNFFQNIFEKLVDLWRGPRRKRLKMTFFKGLSFSINFRCIFPILGFFSGFFLFFRPKNLAGVWPRTIRPARLV